MTTRPAPALLWLAAAIFLILGALQASYGPSFAGYQARFGLNEVEVSRLFVATFASQLLATLGSGWLLGRLGIRRMVQLSLALLTAGLLGMALGSSWPLTLLGALVAGIGYGLGSVGLNLALARQGARGALTLVNAAFGFGSISGPYLVAVLAGRGVSAVFWVLTVVAALLTLASRAFPQLPPAAAHPREAAGKVRAPLGTLLLFNLLLLLYVGIETSTGAWMARHLTPSYGLDGATRLVSLYWLALALGRVLLAPLAARLRPQVLVPSALALAGLAALLALGSGAAPALRVGAYLVIGLALAPIYPNAFAWLVTRVPERFVNLGLLGTGGGAALVPPLIGLWIAGRGSAIIPLALAGVAFAGLLVALWLVGRERRAVSAQST